MAERARRIALLGPPEVTQAAENLAETMQQDVDATAKFAQAAEAGHLAMDERPADVDALQMTMEHFEERAGQLQELLSTAHERGESLDGHPLLSEVLASADQNQAAFQEALGDLQANSDQLSALVDQAAAVVDLITRNQAARELSREQFTAAARQALGTPPLSEKS